MYLVAWSDEAFEQMSRIVSDNPAGKTNWLALQDCGTTPTRCK